MKNLAALLGGSIIVSAGSVAQAQTADHQDNRRQILTSMIGAWDVRITGTNHRSGERFDISGSMNCFHPGNDQLVVCEMDTGGPISHDVYQFRSDTGQFVGAYNGVTAPDLHYYDASGIDETDLAGAWHMIVETEDEFGGARKTRRIDWRMQNDTMVRAASSRLVGETGDFRADYTITSTRR